MNSIIKYLSFFVFLGAIFNSFAQTKITDCNTKKPYVNAIVINADTNEWYGNTDSNGLVVIPNGIESVQITHPQFGEQIVFVTEKEICIDLLDETLETIVIEQDVKSLLLEILNTSNEKYKKENKGKRFYNINSRVYSETDNKDLEIFRGILVLDNIFNSSFNNYDLGWSPSTIKNKSFEKLETFSYLNHIEYNIFASKSTYKDFIKHVNKSQVSKIKNTYYIYPSNSDEFISIEVDPDKKLIKKFINTEVTINSNQRKPSSFGKKDKILMSKFELVYTINESYYIENLHANEKYLVDDNIFGLENTLKQEKYSKEEAKKLDGKGVFGFAFDYVKKRSQFLNKHTK